jgi:hypothetical protein
MAILLMKLTTIYDVQYYLHDLETTFTEYIAAGKTYFFAGTVSFL